MKALIPFLLLGALLYLIGSILHAYMARTNKSKNAIRMVTVVFFGSPIILFFILAFEGWQERRQFEADVNYVRELCAKHGGDKIYRTVDNVEGVFQITNRPYITEAGWQDQYGMQDPWGKAQGDSDSTLAGGGPSIPLGKNGVRTGVDGYQFLEQHTAFGESNKPYLRRTRGNNMSAYVSTLQSRYGYQTEDISTPEMRKRWIAGGRIKIINLQTREILAERVGYFRSIGKYASMHWAGASAYGTEGICPNKSQLGQFLTSTLHPSAD